MRFKSLLAIPLALSLTTPALARHDGRHDNGHHGGYDRHDNRHDDRRGHDRGWDDHHDRRGGDWDRGRSPRYASRGPIIIIEPYERDYIRGYYRQNPYNWDRGVRWRPVIGVRVPYGIPCRPVPYGLARGLPYYPGYERYVVGRDIVLVALATGIIVDVFFNAF